MDLDYLLLCKEELPIVGENRFQIPIYPSLLREESIFDEKIALRMFPLAANEWHEDLQECERIIRKFS